MSNDEIYLIYKGFGRDVNSVFTNFIDKLNFEIDYKSDYRLEMHNSISKITILSEISLSIWIYNRQYPEGILINQLLYDCNTNLYNQFVSIADFIFNNGKLLEL